MSQSFFLGRTQEQDQFRQVLRQYVPASLAQKWVPTFASWVGQGPQLPDVPYIFLFHGPGGMGKTTLTRRLKELVAKEFQGQYQTALVDWDRQRDLNAALQRAHDTIEPQTVLDVLHKELKQSLKNYSGEAYSEARQEIQRIEADVEKALESEPPNTELKDVTAQYGGKAIAWIAKKATEGMITVDPTGATVAIKVGATLLNQARQLLAKSSLSQAEIEIFKEPLETLLESLGKDIAKATQRQPGIIFLDTYEIVDREICDYTLRQVIQQGGSCCIWVISGRSNLSKSGKRGKEYFRGYIEYFSEAQIYPRELLQFSFREIQEYFENKKLSLTADEAESIAEFSLGIPFVVDLAAAMCEKGKPVAEIVAPVLNDNGETNDRDQVIRETCERFLKHCLDTPETLADRQLTFALAMLRRSQMDLLGAMVDAPTGLQERLKALQGRYSFLAEDERRLDEKMANFMQDYLLQDLQRQDDLVQRLNDNAIAWLELQIEERQKTFNDTAEWFEDERLSGWMLDLVHHYGWREEDALWGYLVPRFVEAWQYDRPWARNLLQVGETFGRLLAGANRKLLSRMAGALVVKPDLEDMSMLLETLDKWLTRQPLETSKAQELKAILQLRRGRYLYQAERNDEALAYSLSIADGVPVGSVKLANAMSSLLDALGFRLGWQKRDAFANPDAKRTFEKAIQINVKNAYAYYGLRAMQYKFKEFDQAIQSLQKAIDLREGDYSLALNALGNTYSDLKRYDEAIERYEKAIELDPSDATAHNNLGNTYSDLKRYDEAIERYEKAIELDPSDAKPHNGLGVTYEEKKDYQRAIEAYQTAIGLDPEVAYPYRNLGDVYKALEHYGDEIASYEKAIELAPDDAYYRTLLGGVLTKQKQYGDAIASYQKAIELSSDYIYARNGLGWVYLLDNQLNNAQETFEKAIEIDEKNPSLRFNLGITHTKQNNLEKAHKLWQQGLDLLTEDNEWSNVARALFTFAIGNTEQGITDMQTLVVAADVDVAALEDALGDAEILVTCLQPPSRINDMITLLRDAIAQQSSQ